jgi:LysM repeat protein
MSIKSMFTKDEWQLITDGPEWVFAALAAADGNVAMMIQAKESNAFKKVIKDYSSTSPLVQEVVGDKTKASKDVKKATLSDAEQALEEINRLLDSKLSSSDAAQFRKFLTSVADSIAEAAGEGALGLGKKISKKEEKALEKVKAALKPGKVATVQAKPTIKPVAKPVAKPMTKPEAKPAKPAPSAPKRPVQSSRPVPRPAQPQIPTQGTAKVPAYIAEHTVISGETLSHVSLKYYGSAAKAKYMAIYEANKALIGDNPNLIVPGQVLKIPKLDE